MSNPVRGSREVEHTADRELFVWGPDLTALLEEAALGMYGLMGFDVSEESRCHRRLEITADDREQLVASFLEELLFLAETEELAFDGFLLNVEGTRLLAHLEGGFIVGRREEIKAVTYHRLQVRDTPHGVETSIIFDI